MTERVVIGDAKLWLGDCLEVLPTLAAESVDAVVTDPPAGISFMGKEWDRDKGGRNQWIAWMTQIAAECLRVLKPGGHAFVWSLPRTSHWTATAWEDAGFEPRDCVYHIFGSGFPKSLDISKAIDKAAGAEREVVGQSDKQGAGYIRRGRTDEEVFAGVNVQRIPATITAPATPAARQWDGWGTALKPAAECWWLFRKPLSERTIAANVLRWGCGGINVDGGRIPMQEIICRPARFTGKLTNAHMEMRPWMKRRFEAGEPNKQEFVNNVGRFPANVIFDEAAGAMLDEMSGVSKSSVVSSVRRANGVLKYSGVNGRPSHGMYERETHEEGYSDTGGASRFFYCPKASRSEREAGLEGMEEHRYNTAIQRASQSLGEEGTNGRGSHTRPYARNHHPTVKPLALMRYLCRLITPPGGVILDPFLGSGSSGCAATLEGFAFVGIEREAEYLAIAEKRIAYWQSKAAMPLFEAEPLADPDPASPPPDKPRLF